MKKQNKLSKLLEGISSIICLFPQENKRKITLPNSSISNSLQKDWEKIGNDMWHAFEQIDSKQIYREHNGRLQHSSKQRF